MASNQSDLKQIRFDVNLSDVSSVDKITLNIRNTLMRDLPSEARATPELQQVILKSLMSTLSKSKPTAFCKEIYDVDTFNTAFNTEACRLIFSTDPAVIQTPIRN